jgi:hypothetical protein
MENRAHEKRDDRKNADGSSSGPQNWRGAVGKADVNFNSRLGEVNLQENEASGSRDGWRIVLMRRGTTEGDDECSTPGSQILPGAVGQADVILSSRLGKVYLQGNKASSSINEQSCS